jgi:hypothetical protein
MLPFMGSGYWSNLDFATPLLLTTCHNWYVMVMGIEQFSKSIEMIALLKKIKKAIWIFLGHALNQFGAFKEILKNQGKEFLREDFQILCGQDLIDYQTTSQDHMKMNRLGKRWCKWSNGVCKHMVYKMAT